MKLAVVIPAYNEEEALPLVLGVLPKTIVGVKKIISIVVDDGSSDKTHLIAKKMAHHALKHTTNLGVGAATITGLEKAKQLDCDIIVTLDADGQHHPNDIEKILQPILNKNADLVIGTRMLNYGTMPLIKVAGNWIMNLITFVIFRSWVSDSQSGMKAISKQALKKMKLHSIGYEICSEIIGDAKEKKLKIVEVPIQTIYSSYSKIKGQNMFNAVNIFTRILFFKVTGRK